jgi:hypothetical protein
MLVPTGWFAAVFAEREFWPGVLGHAALALGVNLLLLVVIFALDARYLEAAAAASAKAYARLERMRAGSPIAAFAPAPGRPRFSLPDLPDWGGAGPVLWRQMLSAVRGVKGMSIFLLILIGSSLGPMAVAGLSGDSKLPGPGLAGMLVGMVGLLSLMATQMIAFDFRADYERMDTLKALPVAPARIVLGQLATPVLLASLFQAGACVLIAAVVPDAGPVPLIALAFLVPVNVLSIGLDNLLFLIYPTRLVAAGPGDVRTGIRQMLVMFAKTACLAAAFALAAGVAALAYFLLGHLWAVALAAGWLVLTAACVPLVPLCAAAFRRFDVSRDV